MLSACGRYVIVFNGEIYNHRELRGELDGQSYKRTWRGHSDTEVMLAAISRWGLARALERFNGMFAFALWDRDEQVLHLVRDRLGKKPLYYGWMGPVFLFGSELKALRAHPAFRAEIDRGVLTLYLRHNCVPAPLSIYRGVYKLPPGCVVSIDCSSHGPTSAFSPYPRESDLPSFGAPVRYWSPMEVAKRGLAHPFQGSVEEATAQLDSLLRDAVKLRMVADVPLGSFLSGGIDSSTVVALMQAQSERPVRTFTIGFHEAEYDEARCARAVAQYLGTEHTEMYITPEEAMAVIPDLPDLYDEPFSDSSQIPTFLVSRLARRHVTVSLSGDGGDEVFGGYNRHLWCNRIWNRVGWIPKELRGVTARAILAVSPIGWEALFRRLEPLLPNGLRQRTPGDKLHKLAGILAADSPDAMYLGLVSHWKHPASLVVGGFEPRATLTGGQFGPEHGDIAHIMMYLDMVTYLPDDILTKVDRASMGVSLEARAPLLDYRVVEFAWRVPLSMKIRQGQGKWLLRQVLYRYVPRELVERPKAGFSIPIDAWLRGPLRGWAEELLGEPRLRNEGFFDARPIRQKWSEHLAGRRNWQYDLWDILMFQAWMERWMHPYAGVR